MYFELLGGLLRLGYWGCTPYYVITYQADNCMTLENGPIASTAAATRTTEPHTFPG